MHGQRPRTAAAHHAAIGEFEQAAKIEPAAVLKNRIEGLAGRQLDQLGHQLAHGLFALHRTTGELPEQIGGRAFQLHRQLAHGGKPLVHFLHRTRVGGLIDGLGVQ